MTSVPLRQFLIDLGYHPLFWPIALFAPLLVLFLGIARLRPLCRHVAYARYAAAAWAVVLLGAFLAAAGANLFSAAFPDHVQPSVACSSALFWRGQPVYQDFATPERYSLVYGPLLFAGIGASQGLLGATVFATKLPGTLAALAALVLTFLVIAKATDRLTALSFTGLAAAFLLHSLHLSFSVRSDPFLLLAVALGMYAATHWRSRSALVLGLCLGGAVSLKLHALAYFFPVLALALRQQWSVRACRSGWIIAVLAVVLPFLLPQFSLVNYVRLLGVASKHPLGVEEYRGVLEWCAALAFPALFSLGILWVRVEGLARSFLSRERLFLAALGLAFLLILAPAAKVGAGKHHFLPLIPLVLLFTARAATAAFDTFLFRSAAPALAAALGVSWIAGCSIAALRSASFIFQTSRADDAEAARCLADLRAIAENERDSALLVLPGDDDGYKFTFGRFQLLFDRQPTGLDACAMMDYVRGDAGQIDLAALCRTTTEKTGKPVQCLVPRGAAPFSMRTFYPPFGPLFGDEVHSDFRRLFDRAGSTEFFDLYKPR